MIVKDAWVHCAEEDARQSHRDLRKAIYGMVFFGTPHNGMQVEEMISCVQGQPGEVLARDLRPGSSMVKLLKERFARAVRELRILSCYETLETPTLVLDSKGNPSRTGEKKMMVPESSACLFWPDDIETRIPIDANHSMIAKLSTEIGSKYHDICKCIAAIAKEAVMPVRCRFFLHEIYEAMEKTCSFLTLIEKRSMGMTGFTHKDLLLDTLHRAKAIHSTLTHPDLGTAILGAHSGYEVVSSFAEKTFQLVRILSPYEVLARERDPEYRIVISKQRPSITNSNRRIFQISDKRVNILFNSDNVAATLIQAQATMQAQVQTLSISMLSEPVDQDLLRSHSPARKAGLCRIAAIQALFHTPSKEYQAPLKGSLSILHSDSGQVVDGLVFGDYKGSHGQLTQRVLVEYKTYGLPKNQYLRGLSEEDEKQAAVTKALAQKLASLLRKSSLEAEDADQALREFDTTTSTFRCLGYKDEPESSRLALLYEVPRAAVVQESGVCLQMETLRQAIDKGLKIPLECKFQLAFKICTTVLNLHCSGWVHKSIRPDNVVLIPKVVDMEPDLPDGNVDDYDVYLKGFEFSRQAVGKSNPFESSDKDNLYRHPDRQGLPDQRFTKEYDLYAIGLVLLEIGLGRSLLRLSGAIQEHMCTTKKPETPQAYREGFRQLARKNLRNIMGTRYACAVIRCLDGPTVGFDVHKDDGKHETDLALAFQQQVVWDLVPGMDL